MTTRALSGILAAAVVLGIGQLVSVPIGPASSPFFAVGSTTVDRSPAWAREFAITTFGTNDKPALFVGMTVLIVVLAAVAGIIQVARFSSVDALRGEGMELQAVVVTVIGGTLLAGGYGSVVGTVLGAITFGMIQVGLVLAGAPGHFFRTLTGLIVVGAVVLNTSVARRMASSKPLGGFKRSSEAADAAIASASDTGTAEAKP